MTIIDHWSGPLNPTYGYERRFRATDEKALKINCLLDGIEREIGVNYFDPQLKQKQDANSRNGRQQRTDRCARKAINGEKERQK